MNFRRVLAVVLLAGALVGCGADRGPRNIGERVELGDLRFQVTKVVVGGNDDGPWFQVWMRMKNTSDHSVGIPAATVVCAGSDVGGSLAPIPDRHYAIKPGARIFVGSSAAGVMRLLAPRRPCATPAVVKVTGGEETLTFRIPNSVVEGLNSY
ncbi:MAG TPA: hypothetical protein VF477_05020 [Mycobacterium sp.]